jgi:uncharacterized membrane protein YdbT with pleckstrin-like domain
VPDLTIRPTVKLIKAGAILACVAVAALEVLFFTFRGSAPVWLAIVPPLVLLWPAARWMARRFTKVSIIGDRLRYETGMLSRSTRTIQLSKIQDVRVDQRFTQRMYDVGDLAIETAGETSRLAIQNVDSPQELADEIMNRVQHGTRTA